MTETINYTAKHETITEVGTIKLFSCQIQPTGSDTKLVNKSIPKSTTLDFNSKLIEVSHSVDIDLTLNNLITSLLEPHIKIPVVIGNVPFRSTESVSRDLTKDATAANLSSVEGPPFVVPGCPSQKP